MSLMSSPIVIGRHSSCITWVLIISVIKSVPEGEVLVALYLNGTDTSKPLYDGKTAGDGFSCQRDLRQHGTRSPSPINPSCAVWRPRNERRREPWRLINGRDFACVAVRLAEISGQGRVQRQSCRRIQHHAVLSYCRTSRYHTNSVGAPRYAHPVKQPRRVHTRIPDDVGTQYVSSTSETFWISDSSPSDRLAPIPYPAGKLQAVVEDCKGNVSRL